MGYPIDHLALPIHDNEFNFLGTYLRTAYDQA